MEIVVLLSFALLIFVALNIFKGNGEGGLGFPFRKASPSTRATGTPAYWLGAGSRAGRKP
jgi:hypothetical protein